MSSKGGEKNINYKSRLEKKLYLARENPEPIFDLSDCNLKAVPNNIYSLCRVFRKDSLYLQKNKLSSLNGGGELRDLFLLTLLDISLNNFKKLPSDIDALENLKILNISQNELKELPETIGNLVNLLHLNASNNQLKCLPDTIGGCKKIEYLNVEGNKDLKSLPTSLAKLHSLNELLIDSDIIYPMPEICKGGVKAILKYLAEECGEDYETLGHDEKPSSNKKALPYTDNFNVLQEKVRMLEKMKEEKQKELLALEEQIMNENKKEFEIQQSLKCKRNELMSVLRKQQQSLDEEITKVHDKKEIQRLLLIKECNNAEKNANIIIKEILTYNNSLKEKLAKRSEMERKEEQDMLLNLLETKAETVKPAEKAALLASMNELLREEIKRYEGESSNKRSRIVEAVIAEDKKSFENLREFMKISDRNQSELIRKISEDEKLQRSAVSSLLERNDAQLWQIRNQIGSIQAQLLVLTQVELARKKLEAETNLAALSESRLALTELIMELFRQQTERRLQLINYLRKMDSSKEEQSETFWLDQYKKLLNAKSHQLVGHLKKINQELANEFFLFGVFHYLPLLDDITSSTLDLKNITVQNLINIGITRAEDQERIMKAIESYMSKKDISPTAPAEPTASAPHSPMCIEYKAFVSNNEECVICMDSKSDVIIIPCGHVCCCYKCSESIASCPLCRTVIEHILEANLSPKENAMM